MSPRAYTAVSSWRRAQAHEPPLSDLLCNVLPRGVSWRDHLVRLLGVASSIEHALMVEYLFAAYSLDPAKDWVVAHWRDHLLSVAKEEMGHLLTVQNVLCLLGAPVALGRQNLPYGFPFKLERLTIESLESYLSSEGHASLLEGVQDLLPTSAARPKRPETPPASNVADLYSYIIELIGDSDRISDAEFYEGRFRLQASWDEWSRGHDYTTESHAARKMAGGARENILIGAGFADIVRYRSRRNASTRADVIVERVATRSQAVRALKRIGEQGEAAPLMFEGSHFERFNAIRGDLRRMQKKHKNEKGWEPTHRVAENPHTRSRNRVSGSTITCRRSEKWADLFNLRYRMLLTYLSHTFRLTSDGREAPLLGAVIHKAFGEMYNLKAIAGILVRQPLTDDPGDHRRAGPPFEVPESLALPKREVGCWRRHRDLLARAQKLGRDLRKPKDCSKEEVSYLVALEELDRKSFEWVERVIAGLSRGQVLSR
jgi:hypothetical protein